MKAQFTCGSVVWARVATNWWPGVVTTSDKCPIEYIQGLKREPILIVKFFNEKEFFDVHRQDSILSYSSTRRQDLIRKGLNSLKANEALLEKFEADVQIAEKLTGGNPEVIKELKMSNKKKINYEKLGFGSTKSKKIQKYESLQKEGFSNISEAIQYKKGASAQPRYVKIDYDCKILEQPKPEGDMKADSNWFKCYVCGYTCSRLNVIIWHNKSHLKKVADYDSGIRIPGRRKRKQATPQSRNQKSKICKNKANQHLHTNGHTSIDENGYKAEELLLDWQDDEEIENSNSPVSAEEIPQTKVNGYKSESEVYEEMEEISNPNKRQVFLEQRDMNSAFDALLAETSTNLTGTPTSQSSNFVCNNDSDSDYSDWEKYYTKESNSPSSHNVELSDNVSEPCNDLKTLNGTSEETLDIEQTEKVPFVENDNVETLSRSGSNDNANHFLDETVIDNEENNSEITEEDCAVESSIDGTTLNIFCDKNNTPEEVMANDSVGKLVIHHHSTGDSTKNTSEESSSHDSSKNTSEESGSHESPKNISEESSSHDYDHLKCHSEESPTITQTKSIPTRSVQDTSGSPLKQVSSKSSSAPAYMLVAVDAQGNNVPMPVLSEGGGHLMAVDASMEDGSTRTLYIDPAHLGPDVDLNNLMLHIDNSGQETVIIPSATEQ